MIILSCNFKTITIWGKISLAYAISFPPALTLNVYNSFIKVRNFLARNPAISLYNYSTKM